MNEVCPGAGIPELSNQKQIIMKNIMKFIYAIGLMIGAVSTFNTNVQFVNSNSAGKFLHPFCEDLPIVMHSHVKTMAGTPISGASVALKLDGTSTPQYTGTTDSNGDYTFDSVAQGSYHYKVGATGYYDKIVALSLHVNTDRTDSLIAK
jgi:hypothetical protein